MYENIYKYLKIYDLHRFVCVLDVWTCILSVWTCILGVWTCLWCLRPIQKDARRQIMNFGWIYTNFYGSILIYTRFNMFIFVFDVLISLVCPISVPQAFFSGEKDIPWFLGYVKSGNCPNCQNFSIYGLWDLPKKTRAEKSRILAVLRPSDLSWWANWWTKRWIDFRSVGMAGLAGLAEPWGKLCF